MISTGNDDPPATDTRRLAAIRLHVDAVVQRAEQSPVHRRHAGEERDLPRLHQAKCSLGIEARQQHEGRSHREAAVHLHGLAEGVEQRQRQQVRVVGLWPAVQLQRAHRVHRHVRVRELGALGLAGRAAGVEDDGGVGRLGHQRLECHRLVSLSPRASVLTPSIGDGAAGSAVITKKCSQPSVCSKPA